MTQTLDLAKAIFEKIEGLGTAAAAAYFGRTEGTVRKWLGGTAQPDIGAAQKVLNEALGSGAIEIPAFEQPPQQGATKPEPAPKTEEHVPTVSDGNDSEKLTLVQQEKAMKAAKKFSIVCPINREMSYAVVLSMLGQWKSTLPNELRGMLSGMTFEPDTMIHRARNILATGFLASGNEWSFWMDSDIIAPIGNPAWFKRRTGSKHPDKWFAKSALEQLTARGKSFIGAVYVERSTKGMLISQPGLSPTGDADKRLAEEIKQGPQDRIVPVGWLGFGCVAVHRKVFEDILKTQPEVAARKDGEPHGFFTAFEGGPQGEDVAFAKRAIKAGHQPILDLSVFCAHVGRYAFNP